MFYGHAMDLCWSQLEDKMNIQLMDINLSSCGYPMDIQYSYMHCICNVYFCAIWVSECKQPKCEKGSIVEFGHVIKNCPQIRTEKKEVANVEGEAVEEQ